MNFASQVEKDTAIEQFDTSDPSKIGDLEEIMGSEIVEPSTEEAAETPAQSDDTQVETPPEETPAETSDETPAESETQTPPEEVPPVTEPKTFEITDKDLPPGYKTVGEVFKAFNEQKALIERQNNKIQTDVEKFSALSSDVQKLQEANNATQQPATTSTDINLEDEAKKVVAAAEKRDKAYGEDAYSDESLKAQREYENANFQYTQKVATSVAAQKDAFAKENEQIKLKNERDLAVDREYKEISDFALENKEEYGLEEAPKVVEAKYVDWAKKVAAQYYQKNTDNWNEINTALRDLELKSPRLIEACQTAGVSVEPPSQDIANYGKICNLIQYRDGVRAHIDGSQYMEQRYNPETRKNDIVRYPNLSSALENKRVREGYYRKKATDAFNNGVSEQRSVAGQRDTSVLSNESDAHAGSVRTLLQVQQDIENLPTAPGKDSENLKKLETLMAEEKQLLIKNAQGSVR